jgi:pimeloyl-ACP methyl ester carboxylesterase
MFCAVILLSVPYGARTEGAVKPTEAMRRCAPEDSSSTRHISRCPERPRRSSTQIRSARCACSCTRFLAQFRRSTNGATCSAQRRRRWTAAWTKQLPAWLKSEDLEYYPNEYSRTEFRGGLNRYRGQDIFWQETPFLIGSRLLQPTLYVGGTDDPVVEFARPYVDNLEKSIPNLGRRSSARRWALDRAGKRRLR